MKRELHPKLLLASSVKDMHIFAPAKINLTFDVKGRRADGFHSIESVVSFLDVGDGLEIKLADSFQYTKEGQYAHHLPDDIEKDLAIRAIKLFEDTVNIEASVSLRLVKNIPAGSGLGGGSSDAAAVLKALNTLYDTRLSVNQLCDLGAELGSDVPVCVRGGTVMMSGRGEVLEDAALPYNGYFLLAWPDVQSATKDVFESYHKVGKHPEFSNDLTAAAISVNPEIGACLAFLQKFKTAKHIDMTGSGSTCFAVFEDKAHAKTAIQYTQSKFPDWWVQLAKIID